jgi:hypothetical protein
VSEATVEPIAVCRTVEELQQAMRQRAETIGISRERIDEIGGLPDGYSAKLLTNPPYRSLGPLSTFQLIGALGMMVALIESPEMMQRIAQAPRRVQWNVRTGKNHWRAAKPLSMIGKLLRQNGALGGRKRSEKLSPAERTAIAKRAARVRWRRWRRERKLRPGEQQAEQRGAINGHV